MSSVFAINLVLSDLSTSLQINGVEVDGLGFVAARQHLDAARPVATLLVERRPRLVESKYSMTKQTDSKPLSPSMSEDVIGSDSAGYSSEEDNVDSEGKNEIEDEEEDSKVCFFFPF